MTAEKSKIKLLVRANTQVSKWTKEDDQVVQLDRYVAGIKESYSYVRERGYSGFLVANLIFILDGKKYDINSKKIFFDGMISPGLHEIETSFREAYYDAKTLNQTTGEEFSKKFFIEVKQDNNVIIDINYAYDGLNKDITIKAFTKKLVKRYGKIEELQEIIEVFSK